MSIPERIPEAGEIAVQNRVAREYDGKRYREPYAKRYHYWWTDEMLARVGKDGRILDNGCGIGLLFDRVSPERIVGLDISGEMLKYAARKSDRLILGNSRELPLKDNSFDVVFCRSLLHHLSEPESAVGEMFRVLRRGGEIVLVETNTSLLSFLPRLIARRGERFSGVHKNLSRRSIERLLEPYFEIEDVAYFGYFAYPLLGFPDIFGIFKYAPFKTVAEPALMAIDNILSRLPGIRTQSWGILIKAVRREK